jgi:biotin carboxyl carrier protein
MKMENNIQAGREGVVEKIFRHKGDAVMEGDVLLIIK